MPNNIDEKAVTVSVRIYERLLATYPADFRREYGPAMKQLFRDQCRDAWSEAQGRGLAALWLSVLPDLAKTSLCEHLSNFNQRESIFMKMIRALRADPRLRATFLRAFALVFLGAFVCSILMAQWLPRKYASTVRIEVQKDTAHDSGNSDPYFMVTQLRIIGSYPILTNVILNLHLNEKLAQQQGKQELTLEETFAYLSKEIEVKQTRMTSLLEVTVKNPDPQLAANIANSIADSYQNARLKLWRDTRTAGIEAFQTNLVAKAELLTTAQSNLDAIRVALGVSDLPLQSASSGTDQSNPLMVWSKRDEAARADYLEYSKILVNLDQTPWDKLGSELPSAYTNLFDQEYWRRSERLMKAKDIMTAVKAEYGIEDPKYKMASTTLEHAQQDYDGKVDAIVTKVRNRVDEDWNYLQIVDRNYNEIMYYRVRDEVENLRAVQRRSEFYLNQAIGEASQPKVALATVRDPARAELKPVNGRPSIFLIWLLGGTLLALVVGGAAALFAVLTRRVSHHPPAPS
jgi:hypothetical protein